MWILFLEERSGGRDAIFCVSQLAVAFTYLPGDAEAEFRFPVLNNKFISGVVFGNLQTANDEQGTKLFQQFQPSYGGGFRVLFNKKTRTNLALDYAFGKFGNKGFFFEFERGVLNFFKTKITKISQKAQSIAPDTLCG